MAGRGRTISYKIKFTRIAVEFYKRRTMDFSHIQEGILRGKIMLPRKTHPRRPHPCISVQR